MNGSAADMQQALVELERRFWAKAGDAGLYREQLADDALMVFPAPFGLMEREATLEAVEASPGWTHFDLDDIHVVQLSEESAALAYRASAVSGAGSPYSCYASSVYVRREGAWKLALHQQTPIEGDAD